MKNLLSFILLVALAPGLANAQEAFITTVDPLFTTGSSSAMNLSNKTMNNNVVSIPSDATARYWNGYFAVVGRAGADYIRLIDPSNYSNFAEYSVGNGNNPHDIAVVGADAYVSMYDNDYVWKGTYLTGDSSNAIDFSSLADGDGYPEIDYMLPIQDHLFVSVQRLDRPNFYIPAGTSYIAVIDTGTDTFVDTDGATMGTQHIALTYPNPFTEIQLDPWTGNLYVGCVNFFGVLDGGVEMIDPNTLQSAGIVLTEAEAGGDILDVEIVAPDKGFAIVGTTSFFTHLIAFDPSTGEKLSNIYTPSDYVLQDIERAPSGELLLSDRTPTNPGIRCYDVATCTEITTSPISTGLAPFDIAFDSPVQTGVRPPAGPAVTLRPGFPNPFNPSTTISYTLAERSHVRLDVYDVLGRRVATLVDEEKAAGTHRTTWDGRDAGRQAMASGVYLVKLRAGSAVETQKVTLIK